MALQLQIALDRVPLEHAVRIASAVAPHTDWIEVGTSLIKQFGMESVRQVVAAAPGVPVLADLKTADDTVFEFGLAYEAGASSATVLGVAADATLDKAVQCAAEHGKEAVVDLLETTGPRRAELAARLPASVVLAAHIGKDAQHGGTDPAALLGTWSAGRRLAVAGGLTAEDLPGLAGAGDLRVIVGSAVTGADDPAAAARHLARAAGRD
ncbi:orotidine 5'-phosphate decarboxylase [Streptomyces sp. TRM S81-3]|uniref:Orotidine 5'-phosphate decarboxylase n=1 Tax=Streptomyces griseicoloratus TaxID=2752516 RepID=A0A926L486_9ACTN|nr:orotidine 5'-phosphate decarboxylase / HUMPS family protein [Streptomyces griseicoloratus]MBD0421655.1 orotidine 5'-phosphate decarboxylase [Streptomyces griseicoloratus]